MVMQTMVARSCRRLGKPWTAKPVRPAPVVPLGLGRVVSFRWRDDRCPLGTGMGRIIILTDHRREPLPEMELGVVDLDDLLGFCPGIAIGRRGWRFPDRRGLLLSSRLYGSRIAMVHPSEGLAWEPEVTR